MLQRKAIIVFIAFLAIVCACSNDESADTTDTLVMPVTLAIPASDGPVYTRAGDPGTYEKFELPKYVYIYIVCKDANNNDIVVRYTSELGGTWIKTKYNGTFASSNDSVYEYNGRIQVHIPAERRATGKVYAALSTVKLDGLPTGNEGISTSGETEQTVQNYKFKVTSEVNGQLQNIYSTPYNYTPDGSTYYGTMKDLNTPTPSLDIVLYHVAAKLDLTWNVEQSAQSNTAVRTLTLSLPTADECYIFKPLENTASSTPRTEKITTDVGSQWYGRASKYVIPITGTDNIYKFGAEIETTTGEKRSNQEISTLTPINKNEAFTPWMRGFITVRN